MTQQHIPVTITLEYLKRLSYQQEQQILNYLLRHANANECLDAAHAYIQLYKEDESGDEEPLSAAQHLILRAKELQNATAS